MAVVTPMMKPSNIWPPSQALTLIVTRALTCDTFWRRRRGNSRTKKLNRLCESTSM